MATETRAATAVKRKAEASIPRVDKKRKRLPPWTQLQEREAAILEALKAKLSGIKDYKEYNEKNLALLSGLTFQKFEELYDAKKRKEKVYKFPPAALVNGTLYQVERRQPGLSVSKVLCSAFEPTLQPLRELKTLRVDSASRSAVVVDLALMPNQEDVGLLDKGEACDFEGNPWPNIVFLVGVSRGLDELMADVKSMLRAKNSTTQMFVVFKYFPSNGAMLAVVLERDEDPDKAELSGKNVVSFGLAEPDDKTVAWLTKRGFNASGVGFERERCSCDGPGKEQFSVDFGTEFVYYGGDPKKARPRTEVTLDLYAVQQAILAPNR